LRNRLLLGASAFVAISSAVEAELEGCGVDPATIRRIPNSVDAARFTPVDPPTKAVLRRDLGIPAGVPVVTFTGRLVAYKGLPLLLQVWREVRARRPDARLLLVGSGGLDLHNVEAELRAFVDRHRLHESVRFVGDVERVAPYLQASDAFVFPTEQEAFGISLIEAMACGLPVVSTTAGGLRDIVTDGRDGLLVEPGKAEQLFDRLVLLLDDRARGAALGAAARRTVERRFTEQAVVDSYAALVRHAAASRDDAHGGFTVSRP
jgi:glycosyltransferase involved in cell wall biosynthesis